MIGLSPLCTGHPRILQHPRVQTSMRFDTHFILPIHRSRGFGCMCRGIHTVGYTAISLHLTVIRLNCHAHITRRAVIQEVPCQYHHSYNETSPCGPLAAGFITMRTISKKKHYIMGYTFSLTVLVHSRSIQFIDLGDGSPIFTHNSTYSALLIR